MTIKEKTDKIREECHKHNLCCNDDWECPLYHCVGDCWSDEELVELHYDMMFPSANDVVNHPDHYTNGSIECIDAMVAAYGKDRVADYCIINSFKYIWRSEHKNGLEDIKKAIWYLNKHVELKESSYEEAV